MAATATGARFRRLLMVSSFLTQGNRVKERMLNPIGTFVAPRGVLDSHRAKFWSATQSHGFMPCVPSGPRNAADGAETVHPIALSTRALFPDLSRCLH